MPEQDRQENTPPRVRVEDADYVLTADEPNVPRVREAAPAGPSAPAVIAVCALLLALAAGGLYAVRPSEGGAPRETAFAAAEVPTAHSAAGAGAALGLSVEDISSPVAAYYRAKGRPLEPGVGVFSVDPDGPAAALQPGDVIVAVNGEPISTAGELDRAAESGETLTLTVLRGGEYLDVTAGPAA